MPGEEEGFIYGLADQVYYVSDIPKLKQRIKDNPASAAYIQTIIDRLEAGDFDGAGSATRGPGAGDTNMHRTKKI
jgi:hypothetical protein